MTTRSPSSSPGPSGKTFDRLLILIGIVAVATALMAGVAAVRAGGSEGTPGAGGGTATTTTVPSDPQIVTFTLNEFSIIGPSEIAPGPTVFEVINEGAVGHNLKIEGGPQTLDLGRAHPDRILILEGTLGVEEMVDRVMERLGR